MPPSVSGSTFEEAASEEQKPQTFFENLIYGLYINILSFSMRINFYSLYINILSFNTNLFL